MLRTIWLVTASAVLATSWTAAAANPILEPALVDQRARRMTPPREADLSPDVRAVVEMADLINIERGRHGLGPLSLDDQASLAARVHAGDMAAAGAMRHVGSDGTDGGERLMQAGYQWSSWGENLGAGFFDPGVLVVAWMNSPDHRANLLGDFADVGIGVASTPDGVPYWSLLVARRAGGS